MEWHMQVLWWMAADAECFSCASEHDSCQNRTIARPVFQEGTFLGLNCSHDIPTVIGSIVPATTRL
eukprot:779739-Amphidinium_carterae.1